MSKVIHLSQKLHLSTLNISSCCKYKCNALRKISEFRLGTHFDL